MKSRSSGLVSFLTLTVLALITLFAPAVASTVDSSTKKQQRSPTAYSPTQVIQNYEKEIKDLVAKYHNKDQPHEKAERDQMLKKKVRRFFAFDELARLSLSSHWKSLSQEQKNSFVQTFRQLIERSYLRKSQDMVADYDVEYGEEEINGKQATVTSKIKKDDLDVEIVYNLRARGSRWMIYNVILDNLNLLNNYRSQFNRIIRKKSFAELLRIMEQTLKKPVDTV